ncbi:hypothetical protein SAJA_03295 [Salinisphaera japonica YTM-1]|uniref:Uncharacterized protein n=1 Tax=Salinisphaera japonica YTM-1 TaxID=1209778 RepID=A0A423Q015_9GAMM|nr:hypothetical protein SAJA_03295 [Salinisphaera japonica YTM-1]
MSDDEDIQAERLAIRKRAMNLLARQTKQPANGALFCS